MVVMAMSFRFPRVLLGDELSLPDYKGSKSNIRCRRDPVRSGGSYKGQAYGQ